MIKLSRECQGMGTLNAAWITVSAYHCSALEPSNSLYWRLLAFSCPHSLVVVSRASTTTQGHLSCSLISRSPTLNLRDTIGFLRGSRQGDPTHGDRRRSESCGARWCSRCYQNRRSLSRASWPPQMAGSRSTRRRS